MKLLCVFTTDCDIFSENCYFQARLTPNGFEVEDMKGVVHLAKYNEAEDTIELTPCHGDYIQFD